MSRNSRAPLSVVGSRTDQVLARHRAEIEARRWQLDDPRFDLRTLSVIIEFEPSRRIRRVIVRTEQFGAD
jgi:hypothetical protein